ncbi:kynurenine 3-monooxygenase [Holotrichia oblita]|uniref:Kynurenine 3-monooxygenase n=1 Tax=Holotrichia oblita TaxID=644536 RepID=A0ACB9SSI2_HOLOL|nr:kynurenine 3-monooxygenase [Holotrichia oblita]
MKYFVDLRKNSLATGKSINLALSNRARKAMRIVGLEEDVLSTTVHMKGRYIHELSGNDYFLPYDPVHKQNLYSINRNRLNSVLLTAAEDKFNVNIFFEYELVDADLKKGIVHFKNLRTHEVIEKTSKLIIGADGAHSSLRNIIQQQDRFSFSQKYIEHGYVELIIKPTEGKLLDMNAFHLWPRRTFLMIAIPNPDASFTVTLFMSFDKFKKLNNSKLYLQFFDENFPDAINLLGAKQITEELPLKKPRYLVSIYCRPYHFEDKFLLIGDAAHAMVPFYGQGMNAGFEDCTVLNQLLDLHNDDFAKVIENFTNVRNEDARSICELAMYNYKEMSSYTLNKSFRLRKCIDELLYSFMPEIWIPLYVSVTFSDMKYKKCIENRRWQDKVIRTMLWILSILVITFSFIYYYLTMNNV